MALKKIYQDVLARENAWKDALGAMNAPKETKTTDPDEDRQPALVLSVPRNLLNNLQVAGGGGNRDVGIADHDGGHRTMTNAEKKLFREQSKQSQLKPGKVNPIAFAPRINMRIDDNIPMNRRVGRPLLEPPTTGAIPKFKFK